MKTTKTATSCAAGKTIQTKQPGFSLIELIFYIALAGLLYASVAQMLPKKRVGQSISDLVLSLNSLAALASQEAICKNLPAQVEFKPSNKNGFFQVRAKLAHPKAGASEVTFELINNGFITNKIAFPESIVLVEWQLGFKPKERDARTLIIPVASSGTSMPAILHFKAHENNQTQQFSLEFNPFLCKFKLKDGWIPFIQKENDADNKTVK